MKADLKDINAKQYNDEYQLAIQRSLEEYHANNKRFRESLNLIHEPFRPHKLKPISIPREGDCQFEAITTTAKINIRPKQLRLEACNYLSKFLELFAIFQDGFDHFNNYLAYMRKPGSWGDHLTLMAIAHLMMRPIRVITDGISLPDVINPPDFIAREIWGPELIIAHQG